LATVYADKALATLSKVLDQEERDCCPSREVASLVPMAEENVANAALHD